MNPQCLVCKEPLIEGFLLDKSHGGQFVSTWVEGQPERSFWKGTKIEDQRRMSVAAYLCTKCGRIELYAAPGNESV